jgi:hypothetical protein
VQSEVTLPIKAFLHPPGHLADMKQRQTGIASTIRLALGIRRTQQLQIHMVTGIHERRVDDHLAAGIFQHCRTWQLRVIGEAGQSGPLQFCREPSLKPAFELACETRFQQVQMFISR